VDRALRNVETFFNPDPWLHTRENANVSYNELIFSATLYDGNSEPKHMFEAKKSKDWLKWNEAMNIEFKNMKTKMFGP
jgi:hypothetical protein